MSTEKYNDLYIDIYNLILDNAIIIKDFLHPGKYLFTRFNNMELSQQEKMDFIKNDLECMNFTDAIGKEFTEILELYYPGNNSNFNEELNFDFMIGSAMELKALKESLSEKYLPFIKKMEVMNYPKKYDKKYTVEEVWETILKDKEYVTSINIVIEDLVWAILDSSNIDIVDNILKEKYHLNPIQFTRYILDIMEGEKESSVKVIDSDLNKDKIKCDFNEFDKYFSKICGQDVAIEEIKKVLKRNIFFYNAEDLNKNDKKSKSPLATFMFFGPTGTGKTETAKIIADFVYNDAKKLLILDMNSYKDAKVASSAIKGHPEGYVDSKEGTDFTRFLQVNDKGVIVLDEFEKASDGVREIFMTMIDEGVFKDALGNVYDMSKYIFIATTNANDKFSEKNTNKIGFGSSNNSEDNKKEINEKLREALREEFTAPIMNRFSNLIHFKNIKYDDALTISNNLINKLCKSFESKKFDNLIPKIKVKNIDEISKIILKKCNFEEDGVRSMKNVINDEIGSEIMELILDKKGNIVIDSINNKIKVVNVIKKSI